MLYWTVIIVGCLIIASLIAALRGTKTPGAWLIVVAAAAGVLWVASLVDNAALDDVPLVDTQATPVPPSGYQSLPPATRDYEQTPATAPQ